jgi:hypothetical protein
MRRHVAIFKDSPRNQLGQKICGKVRRRKILVDTSSSKEICKEGGTEVQNNESS